MERCDYDFLIEEKRQNEADARFEEALQQCKDHIENRLYDFEEMEATMFLADVVQEAIEEFRGQESIGYNDVRECLLNEIDKHLKAIFTH